MANNIEISQNDNLIKTGKTSSKTIEKFKAYILHKMFQPL